VAGICSLSQIEQGLPGPQTRVPGPLPTSASGAEPTPTLKSRSALAFGGAVPTDAKFCVVAESGAVAQMPPVDGAKSAEFWMSAPGEQMRASMPKI